MIELLPDESRLLWRDICDGAEREGLPERAIAALRALLELDDPEFVRSVSFAVAAYKRFYDAVYPPKRLAGNWLNIVDQQVRASEATQTSNDAVHPPKRLGGDWLNIVDQQVRASAAAQTSTRTGTGSFSQTLSRRRQPPIVQKALSDSWSSRNWFEELKERMGGS